MKVEKNIQLIEEILSNWKTEIGDDFDSYKNHVYRMLNFCFALHDFDEEARTKLIIAACFHDIGIWTAVTFDYLPPSILLAKDYLQKNNLESWTSEIELMIDTHHKIGKYEDAQNPSIEVFRQGDLVDFSLGFVKCGLPKTYVKTVKNQFPNAGFHKCLARLASRWLLKHPLNPIPVLKW